MVDPNRREERLDGKRYNLRKVLLSRIDVKLTVLFVVVGLIAPAAAIFYFYSITVSFLPDVISNDEIVLFRKVAVTVIFLIAINTGLVGFLISRSISKPIKELYNAARELEKGNYNIELDIRTGDEIQKLGEAFKNAASALAKVERERKEIEDAKTEFLSITSHELRTPITPIRAQLEMLKNGYFGELTEKQKESIEVIIRNTDRLDNIITDFLEVSRIEGARLRFNFVKTDLSDIVREVVKLMDAFAKEKNIEIVVDTDDLPIVETDPDRISQVLRNLLTNAIKFSNENSKIEVEARLREEDILFSVRDYGMGIKPEDQLRIFEPFYQVEKHSKRRYGGTGLGLTICRGIIEAQNGKIWVESKVGKGSKFYFTVPLKPVKEIKPIRLLFSQKSIVESKLKEEFQTMLGPIGGIEFDELKNKNALNKEDLYDYIDSLTEQFIISKEKGYEFKRSIDKILGGEDEVENEGIIEKVEVIN